MKTKKVTLTAEIYLSFDENEKEFKESLELYRNATESVDDDETLKNTMLQHIAWHISSFGTGKKIEGVGYVSIDGVKPKKDWCGVDADSNDFTLYGHPEYEIDIN